MRIIATIFYWYIWVSFNIWLGYFYRYNRKKHTTGIENVPLDKPVIFCSNHPNSFMDAIMGGSSVPRRTWFLARSDVFRKRALANFLTFVGIIPIYRLLEGAENLSKNDETFERCSQILKQNKPVMIFSEGLCVMERRLRKLKKGTARIAFGAEEQNDFKLDLMIVPVGLNYSSTPWKFRSTLSVHFGEPFAVKKYEAIYRDDKARAMNQFTRELEERMKKTLVIIENKNNDDLVNRLEEMVMKDWTEEAYLDPDNAKDTHVVSKKLAEIINKADRAEEDRVRLLDVKVRDYFEGIKSIGIRDWLLKEKSISAMGIGSLLADFLFFTFLFPFWIFGLITNYVPYKIPFIVAEKTTSSIEWHASVNGTLSVFVWQIYWLLQSLVVALVFRNWYLLGAFMIAVPMFGMIAQEYWVRMKKSRGKSALIKAFRRDRKSVESLIRLRTEIIEELNLLREMYN